MERVCCTPREAAEAIGVDYKLVLSWVRNEDPAMRPPGFFSCGNAGKQKHYHIIIAKLPDWLAEMGARQ